jgi:hypothetical protein
MDLVLFGSVHALDDVFLIENAPAALYTLVVTDCVQLRLM